MRNIMMMTVVLALSIPMVRAADKKKEVPPYKLPELTENLDERIASIQTAQYQGPERHEARSGDGYTGTELFELHRELRLLVHENFNQAPSAREVELLHQILYGKPDRTISSKRIVSKWKKKAEKGQQVKLFGDGYLVTEEMKRHRITGNRAYLDNAVVAADFLMQHNTELKSDPEAWSSWQGVQTWLGLGRGYAGVAELIITISNNPELHALTAVDGPLKGTELTYKERAEQWMKDLKEILDFRLALEKYEHGRLYETDEEIDYKGGPAAVNRFLYYLHLLLAAADAAEVVDDKPDAEWVAQLRRRSAGVLDYWQRTFQRPEDLNPEWFPQLIEQWDQKQRAYMSEYGPYVIWSYKPDRNHTEDYIHLLMDIEAIHDVFRYAPTIIPEPVMKRIATSLMVCSYNYENGYILFNLAPSGNERNPLDQPPWHTFFNPQFGKYIGKYMPDAAYDKFMKRQLLIWDNQLLQGKLGRFSQYSMPREIIEARWFRFNKTAQWPEIGRQ